MPQVCSKSLVVKKTGIVLLSNSHDLDDEVEIEKPISAPDCDQEDLLADAVAVDDSHLRLLSPHSASAPSSTSSSSVSSVELQISSSSAARHDRLKAMSMKLVITPLLSCINSEIAAILAS